MQKLNKYFIGSLVVVFLLLASIIILDPLISDVILLKDQGSFWYYWKLPIRNSSIMFVVWVLFILHLLGTLFLIIKRVKSKERNFNKHNLALLIYNFIFIIAHYMQSVISYDGLAQDLPIWTSQYSVIVVLIILLVMQIPNRGIFLKKKIKLSPNIKKNLYKIHGFIFTFAIIYTFWFHPLINTIGHLTGFLYIYLLFIQISFIKTKIHYNKYWILILEVMVAIHAFTVAYFVQSSYLWGMFLFGFLFIFVMTQIYSIKLSKLGYLIIQLIFFIFVFIYYSKIGLENIHQIFWIPIIEYLGVLILIILFKIKK